MITMPSIAADRDVHPRALYVCVVQVERRVLCYADRNACEVVRRWGLEVDGLCKELVFD